MNLLPNRGFPAGTRKAQFVTGSKPGPPAKPDLCLPPDRDNPRQEQVYHETAFLAIGSQKVARLSDVVFLHAPLRASSARLKVAVSARRFS